MPTNQTLIDIASNDGALINANRDHGPPGHRLRQGRWLEGRFALWPN